MGLCNSLTPTLRPFPSIPGRLALESFPFFPFLYQPDSRAPFVRVNLQPRSRGPSRSYKSRRYLIRCHDKRLRQRERGEKGGLELQATSSAAPLTYHLVCSSLDRRSGFRHWARSAEGRQSRRLYRRAGCDVEGKRGGRLESKVRSCTARWQQETAALFSFFFFRRKEGSLSPTLSFYLPWIFF